MMEMSLGGIGLDVVDLLCKFGLVGKFFFYIEIKIVDDDGNIFFRGSVGELFICGLNIMLGYWNKLEVIEKLFDGDWFKIGDVVCLDEEGFVYIVDRWKDMYIFGGENVYLVEVENVIY